jgi:hypothetical protein
MMMAIAAVVGFIAGIGIAVWAVMRWIDKAFWR